MLLLLALMIAALPLFILIEYLFEATNCETFTLCGVNIHAPIYYLERLEVRTRAMYSKMGKYSARLYNYLYSLDIPRHIGLFWECTKTITRSMFKSVMPMGDFRKEFIENINSRASIQRTKRQRQLSTDDLTRKTIFETPKQIKCDGQFLRNYSWNEKSKDLDEKSRDDIEEFTNLDSATNVYGMDKIYRMGDKTDPNVDPSAEHNSIIRNNLNRSDDGCLQPAENDQPVNDGCLQPAENLKDHDPPVNDACLQPAVIVARSIGWGDPHQDIKYST